MEPEYKKYKWIGEGDIVKVYEWNDQIGETNEVKQEPCPDCGHKRYYMIDNWEGCKSCDGKRYMKNGDLMLVWDDKNYSVMTQKEIDEDFEPV